MTYPPYLSEARGYQSVGTWITRVGRVSCIIVISCQMYTAYPDRIIINTGESEVGGPFLMQYTAAIYLYMCFHFRQACFILHSRLGRISCFCPHRQKQAVLLSRAVCILLSNDPTLGPTELNIFLKLRPYRRLR